MSYGEGVAHQDKNFFVATRLSGFLSIIANETVDFSSLLGSLPSSTAHPFGKLIPVVNKFKNGRRIQSRDTASSPFHCSSRLRLRGSAQHPSTTSQGIHIANFVRFFSASLGLYQF